MKRFVIFIAFTGLLLTLAGSHALADLDVQWQFKSLGEDSNGTPSTALNLLVNGAVNEITTEMGSVYEIKKEDFKDYGIPKSALVACQCWWAGAGADYWVIKKGQTLVVMERDISEGDPEHPLDYSSKPVKVKTIQLN